MLVFLINPYAGNNPKKTIDKIESLIKNIPNSIIYKTTAAGDEKNIIQNVIREKPNRIIVIGGDGTVNSVASLLVDTKIPLAIIPTGSGNGLARHLNIPMQFEKALEIAVNGKVIQIDVGTINNKYFFCTAGIGFEAKVAHHFSKSRKRGLINYIYSSLVSFLRYNPIEFMLKNEIKSTAFTLSIANANQYGNNAFISPEADIQDGLFELVEIKPINFLQSISVTFHLFNKSLHKSKFTVIRKCSEVELLYKTNEEIQIDGEPFYTESEILKFSIKKNSLDMIRN